MRRTAALLKRPAGARKGLPRLLAFTEPGRTPDLEAVAAALPAGAALVFRPFGAPDAEAVARRLLRILRARRCLLLVGADARLAARIGADGVHLPERLGFRARGLRRRKDWIVTMAAHSLRAARRAQVAGADAAVVSAVFPSRSPSAGPAMGATRLSQLSRAAGLPVYALGGVNERTARRLKDIPLGGLAAVEAFRT